MLGWSGFLDGVLVSVLREGLLQADDEAYLEDDWLVLEVD